MKLRYYIIKTPPYTLSHSPKTNKQTNKQTNNNNNTNDSSTYETCSHETWIKLTRINFLIWKKSKMLIFQAWCIIYYNCLKFLLSKIKISLQISYIFYWFETTLLACIFLCVLATLSGFRENRSHIAVD